MITWLFIFIITIGVAAYFRMPLVVWSSMLGLVLLTFSFSDLASFTTLLILWAMYLVVIVPLNAIGIRRTYISQPVMEFMRKAMPSISQTEQEALDAGDVWWEGELFSGKPQLSKIRDIPAPQLSAEEQAFLDGPVNELCRMLDDWKITQTDYDLSPEVWKFLKENHFFAMIIPKEYGGLEFSALAHSCVVMKIASRSITAGVTVMVPNSLGPGKLLLHYGTQEQKDEYLERLATGKEIPCFALTGPEAGSDAGAMPDTGVVCHGSFDGKKKVLGIRLNWEKRYITLGPVATLLGLAFKLYDPDHLLGGETELGITLALIKTDTKGVEIGNRHFPVNQAFMNGPNRGKDVFIPMDWVIGGTDYIGKGWSMLMECLSDGRAISLPATATGAGKMAARYTGAYARIRKQFKVPIGQFEGVEEVLARIGGQTYAMDATRLLTLSALDAGEVPSVISGIIKYQLTERMRVVLNDAMDIHGGHGICMGPNNFLGRAYEAVPVSITVEGANILTRSLIVFGQGALRSHPYLLKEVEAVANPDREQGLVDFDHALFGHTGFIISNLFRSLWLGLTGARFISVPGNSSTRYYYRQLMRLSASFALLSDACVAILGGDLKRREKLSGRLADALSNLYVLTAVLKHFEDQGMRKTDLPLMQYACEDSLLNVQVAIKGVLDNMTIPFIGKLLRLFIFPLPLPYHGPSDKLGHKLVKLLLKPSNSRDRLTEGIYLSDDPNDPVGRIEHALICTLQAKDAERKLRDGMRIGLIRQQPIDNLLAQAFDLNILDETEVSLVKAAYVATSNAIRVDEFTNKGWKLVKYPERSKELHLRNTG